jgi:type IX secretion system substrate protein
VTPTGPIAWTSLNNSYNVTQFVTVSLARAAGDDRILGGTQDNGSPFFRFDGTTTFPSSDISSGDGGWAYLGSGLVFSSSQSGTLWVEEIDPAGTPSFQNSVLISACQQCGALFINPSTIEPNAEETIFYPAGADLYRINVFADDDWSKLDAMAMPPGYGYSALTMSTEPRGVLYVGGFSATEAPVLYRLDGAETSLEAPTDRSIPGGVAGSYLLHIAVNPLDADEILVTISSYNVQSLYHSFDGGLTYTGVEGNLAGVEDGPSVRTAVIADFNGDKTYFVGTSTGVYATQTLAADQTVWGQVAPDVIGQAPMAWMDHRVSDGKIAVATHGRGVFIGSPMETATANETDSELPAGFELRGNYPNPFNPATSIVFDLAASAEVSVVVSDLLGRTVQTIPAQSFSAGSSRSILVDASNLASGTYLYRVEMIAGGQARFLGGSMVLLK